MTTQHVRPLQDASNRSKQIVARHRPIIGPPGSVSFPMPGPQSSFPPMLVGVRPTGPSDLSVGMITSEGVLIRPRIENLNHLVISSRGSFQYQGARNEMPNMGHQDRQYVPLTPHYGSTGSITQRQLRADISNQPMLNALGRSYSVHAYDSRAPLQQSPSRIERLRLSTPPIPKEATRERRYSGGSDSVLCTLRKEDIRAGIRQKESRMIFFRLPMMYN